MDHYLISSGDFRSHPKTTRLRGVRLVLQHERRLVLVEDGREVGKVSFVEPAEGPVPIGKPVLVTEIDDVTTGKLVAEWILAWDRKSPLEIR